MRPSRQRSSRHKPANPRHPLAACSRRLLLLAALILGVQQALADLPQPFIATYQAEYSGLNVTATRSLKAIDDHTMELRFSAKSWLASFEETSRFSWKDSGQLVPERYSYLRSGLGRDRQAELNFDWHTNTVVNNVQNKPWRMQIPDNVLDKLSYQLQLRHDLLNHKPSMNYKVADGGRLKEYEFKVLGEEVLDTRVGRLMTTKVKRVRDDNERITYLWLANDWDHLVVKIQQQEEDGQHYEINLAAAELNGTPVKGQ